jgi:phosphatidylserine/phosphatidylglycerophosphate/cardiolipin synthase-like enzyme
MIDATEKIPGDACASAAVPSGDVLPGGDPLLAWVRQEASRPLARIRLALGYLYLPGLEPVWDALEGSGAEINLLIGNTAGTLTDEQYVALGDEARIAGRPNDPRLPEQDVAAGARADRARIVTETARALRENLARGAGADAPLASVLLRIARAVGGGRLRVRIYPDGRLHAKAYLFHGAATGEAMTALVGSSNLSLPASGNPTELNLVVRDPATTAAVSEWFDALWFAGQDFTRDLLTEILAAPSLQPTP